MSKNHDENKDIRLVSRIAKVEFYDKTIKAPKSAIIGNKTWGRIDYLVHYCGWTFIWDNSVNVNRNRFVDTDNNTKHKRDAKQAKLDNTMTKSKKR
jgi:hypothetical protein